MEHIIRVENLKKYYREVKAVDDISFSVERGELFGFLGVNGAGKSTTINMLCTLVKPAAGAVTISGLELGKEDTEIKKHIGIVYQNNVLDRLLTVKENLWTRGSLFESNPRILRRNLANVCDILELGDQLKRPYGKLSGGQKRRCELACALMHTPEILFLDEPTTGLDPATRKAVWSALHVLQRDMNMTIFLTTHYMEEAAQAEHIGIMEKGQLIQFGTPFSLKEEFAKDRLCLCPKEDSRVEVEKLLSQQNIAFKWKENRIVVKVASTIEALPVLETVKDLIEGFEVIQGSMDDVFLNATGGK